VRAGRDKQGRVSGVDEIKMDPGSHHIGDYVEWRLNMDCGRLRGPMIESGSLDSFAHGDGSILVPIKRPIRPHAFVE
jgi:hypothetical protein